MDSWLPAMRAVSSAKRRALIDLPQTRTPVPAAAARSRANSLIMKLKRSGEREDPWRTPRVLGISSECCPATRRLDVFASKRFRRRARVDRGRRTLGVASARVGRGRRGRTRPSGPAGQPGLPGYGPCFRGAPGLGVPCPVGAGTPPERLRASVQIA